MVQLRQRRAQVGGGRAQVGGGRAQVRGESRGRRPRRRPWNQKDPTRIYQRIYARGSPMGAADLKASPLPPAPFTVARAGLSAVSKTFGGLGRSLVFFLCSLWVLCESLGMLCESLGVLWGSLGVPGDPLRVLGGPLGVLGGSLGSLGSPLGVPWSVLGVRGCAGRPKYQFCLVKVRFWEALGIKMSVLLSKSKLWGWSGGQIVIFA